MIRRALPPALALALLASACGGGGDGAATGTTAGSEVAATAGRGTTAAPPSATGGAPDDTLDAPDATAATPAPGSLEVPVLAGDPVDPAAVDPCSVLTTDEIAAAFGTTVTNPTPYDGAGGRIAECSWTLGNGAPVTIQIELELPPGSQTLNDGRPFAAGVDGAYSDSAYPIAITAINGWQVTLSALAGQVTEEQLVVLARLLEQRLLPRDASSGGGAPAGPSGDGSGDGTCSVEVTGALTDSYTSGQDTGEAYAIAWIPAEEQEMADSVFGGNAPDFQVGCSGDDGQSVLISILDADVPLGSTSVTVPDNTAGYFSNDGLVGNRGPAEIVLTKFDETGMAGSITFTGDGLGTGESTVSMTFDFTNDWAG